MIKGIFISIAIVIGIGALMFGLQFAGLVNYGFFAPKYEKVRRNVYEETQSYVEGKRQEIVKYKLEYQLSKDPAEKEAIRRTIIQTTANLDLTLLSPDLEQFVLSLRMR